MPRVIITQLRKFCIIAHDVKAVMSLLIAVSILYNTFDSPGFKNHYLACIIMQLQYIKSFNEIPGSDSNTMLTELEKIYENP